MMFPSIMTFPVDGVHLKQDQQYNCNKHICAVVLDGLKRRSTGSYRCEISGDAPEFHVVHETANLTIAGEWFGSNCSTVTSALLGSNKQLINERIRNWFPLRISSGQ